MSDSERTCSNCGARLLADAAWCGQCLTPVAKASAPQQAGVADSTASPGPRLPRKTEPTEYVYSRWKGDATTFGPAGRIFLTILLAVGLFAGYFLFTGGITSIGPIKFPVLPSIILYAIIASFLGAWALKTIWKKARVN